MQIDPDFIKSFRRSRLRVKIFWILVRLGEAYPAQLARLAKTDLRAVHAVLHGEPPRYRAQLALAELDLARAFSTRVGEAYRVTSRGRQFAVALSAGGDEVGL